MNNSKHTANELRFNQIEKENEFISSIFNQYILNLQIYLLKSISLNVFLYFYENEQFIKCKLFIDFVRTSQDEIMRHYKSTY